MLEKEEVDIILKTIYNNFNTEDKIEGYRKSGVNRISIGVQSLDNEILKIIGRIHDREEVFEKFKIVEKYFDSISVDMMFGLPKQTVEILKNNLEEVVSNLRKKSVN